MDTSIVYVITQLKGKINWESVLNKRNLRKNIQKNLAFRSKTLKA